MKRATFTYLVLAIIITGSLAWIAINYPSKFSIADGGNNITSVSEPASVMHFIGKPISWNKRMLLNPQGVVWHNDEKNYGKMNLVDTTIDNTFNPGPGHPKAYNPYYLQGDLAVPARITGLATSGAYGQHNQFTMMGSDDMLHWDTLANLDIHYGEGNAIELDDTVQYLRFYCKGKYPFWIKVYHDPINGDVTINEPAPKPFTRPAPEIGTLIGTNDFIDTPPEIVRCFTRAHNRSYNNMYWFVGSKKNGLYPNDTAYEFNPAAAGGGGWKFDKFFEKRLFLGQKYTFCMKLANYRYGQSLVVRDEKWFPRDVKVRLKNGSEVKIVAQDTLGAQQAFADTKKLQDGKYPLSKEEQFYSFKDGAWNVYTFKNLEIVNDTLKYHFFRVNRDNQQVDDVRRPYWDWNNYKTYAAAAYQVAARYGSNKNIPIKNLKLAKGQPRQKGMNLIYSFEGDNEDDSYWNGYAGYSYPEWDFAKRWAFYDGAGGKLGPRIGVKNADPNLPVSSQGCINGNNFDWWNVQVDLAKHYLPSGELRNQDIRSFHAYSNNKGGQFPGKRRGLTPEASHFYEKLQKIADWNQRYTPWVELELNEYGFDSDPKSGQSLDPDAAGIDPFEAQARGLMRNYLAIVRIPEIRRAQAYMIRDAGVGGGNYTTSGLTTYKSNYYLKTSWYMTYMFCHRLDYYRYAGDVTVNNLEKNDKVWVIKLVDSRDTTHQCYAVWCPTWKGQEVEDYALKIAKGMQSAYRVDYQRYVEMGASRVLNITNNELHFAVSEKPTLVFVSPEKVQKPEAIDKFRVDSVGYSNIQIYYESPSDMVDKVELKYSTDRKNWQTLTMAADAFDEDIKGLEQDQRYYFLARAVNSSGYSPFSDTLIVHTARSMKLVKEYKIDFNKKKEPNLTGAGWLGYLPGETLKTDAFTFKAENTFEGHFKGFGDNSIYGADVDKDYQYVRAGKPATLTFSQLDPAKRYSVSFYSGRNWTVVNCSIYFTHDGEFRYIVAKGNKDKLATFYNLKPDKNNTLVFKAYAVDTKTSGNINAVVLKEYE